MRNTFLILILNTLFIFKCFGQQFIIKGLIIDDSTKEAIVFADVFLKVDGRVIAKTLTDRHGEFVFKTFSKDSCSFKICAIGYKCMEDYKIDMQTLKTSITIPVRGYKRPANVFEKAGGK